MTHSTNQRQLSFCDHSSDGRSALMEDLPIGGAHGGQVIFIKPYVFLLHYF